MKQKCPVCEKLPYCHGFERAIIKMGVVAACEWFGYKAMDPFVLETEKVLWERYPECFEAAQEKGKDK